MTTWAVSSDDGMVFMTTTKTTATETLDQARRRCAAELVGLLGDYAVSEEDEAKANEAALAAFRAAEVVDRLTGQCPGARHDTLSAIMAQGVRYPIVRGG